MWNAAWPVDREALGIIVAMTLFASTATVALSAVCGTILTYRAKPSFAYGVQLASLFLPFAIGSTVWGYLCKRTATTCDLTEVIVSCSTTTRVAIVTLLCLARTIPIGALFCATTLHRHTREIRPYFRNHHMPVTFFMVCSLNRLPRSIMYLLGLMAGAVVGLETALPKFLYGSNPGSRPVTVNIILATCFREARGHDGPNLPGALTGAAILGIELSLMLVIVSFLGSLIGIYIIHAIGFAIKQIGPNRMNMIRVMSFCLFATTLGVFLPSLFIIVSLVFNSSSVNLTMTACQDIIDKYTAIIIEGALVGASLAVAGISVSVRLRYAKHDYLSVIERSPLVACLIMLPTFMPVLTLVAVLGAISKLSMTGLFGYASLYTSHIVLHVSLITFITMTLIAGVPSYHVKWQRTNRLSYWFSLTADGFKRHASAVVALVGLGAVLVITDGSVSTWYSHLIDSPDEAMYAAYFGRLASVSDSATIALFIAIVSVMLSGILAMAFLKDLTTD